MLQDMQLWADIRRRVLVENVSKRQILRETGMHWRTLEKVLANPDPPGYRAKAPRPGISRCQWCGDGSVLEPLVRMFSHCRRRRAASTRAVDT